MAVLPIVQPPYDLNGALEVHDVETAALFNGGVRLWCIPHYLDSSPENPSLDYSSAYLSQEWSVSLANIFGERNEHCSLAVPLEEVKIVFALVKKSLPINVC